MNFKAQLLGCKYPIINHDGTPAGFREIKKVFDIENFASYGISLNEEGSSLLIISIAAAQRLVNENKEASTNNGDVN